MWAALLCHWLLLQRNWGLRYLKFMGNPAVIVYIVSLVTKVLVIWRLISWFLICSSASILALFLILHFSWRWKFMSGFPDTFCMNCCQAINSIDKSLVTWAVNICYIIDYYLLMSDGKYLFYFLDNLLNVSLALTHDKNHLLYYPGE